MESPILNSIIQAANSHLPPPIFLLHSPSLSREKNIAAFHLPHPKSHAALLRFPTFAPIRASPNSAQLNCRGWDDDFQQLAGGGDWAASSGESSFQLRDFVGSIGINDKKYAFTFLLGTVFAFAIARVRVSYIALVPASAVVFAIGFSFGFVRSGSGLGLFSSASTVKRKGNEAISRVSSDRVNAVVAEFLNEFGVRVGELKNSVRRAIDSREMKMDDLERYVHVIEAMETSALNTRQSIEAAVDAVESPKLGSRKRRQIGEVGSELVQSLLSRMFESKKKASSSVKPNKVKQNDDDEQVAAAVSSSSDSALEIEEGVNKDVVDEQVATVSSVSSQGFPSKLALDWDGERRIRIVSDNPEEHLDREGSSRRDPSVLESNGAYTSYSRNKNDGETYSSSSYIDDSRRSNEDLHLMDREDVPWSNVGSSSSSYSSSAVSDDAAFNRYLTEANNLLKEAKECIRGRQEEEHAEVLLYKSAKLLSKSVALKPMSLLAVGQLGNTYLLHGELKLKMSRELRATLSTWGPLSFENQGSISVGADEVRRKDKLVEILTNVCEECEELLVEAGRKYRTALSIDGNDKRALYNWGLALTFRAQLIADIGPEAAFDADKLFLAATDKFDAMMSKSNVHAPDALFRWGLVLQQRSRLRPANSKEKVKLLQQARRLYEDALRMDSDNVQVREALSSCMSELNRRLFRSF